MSTATDASPTHRTAVWLALLVTVLWSSSWILIRWGLDDEGLQPVTFAGLRYGLAAAVIASWVLTRHHLRKALGALRRREIGTLMVLGIVLYTVTQGAQFVAIDHQPAATTSLMLSMTPLIVAALASRSTGERPVARQVAGAALVAVGAWIYFVGDLGATTIGMAAAATGLAANAAAALIGRRVNRDVAAPAAVITAVSMTVGAVGLLGAGMAVEGVPTISGAAWAIIAWLAVVNTAFAFTLWNLSLRRLDALESVGINNTMLVQIAVLAWIFLGEQPGIAGFAGVVVVSLGVFLTQASSTIRPGAPGRPPDRRPTLSE